MNKSFIVHKDQGPRLLLICLWTLCFHATEIGRAQEQTINTNNVAYQTTPLNNKVVLKDLEGITSFTLPENISIFEYTKTKVYPFFKMQDYLNIKLSNNLSTCLYTKKTPQSKINSDKAFRLKKLGVQSQEEQWLQGLLKEMEGRSILFNKTEMVVDPAIGQETPALYNLELKALGRLLVIALFSSKKGLILESSFSEDKLYLVPINKQNLRYLGVFFDKGFDDKTYTDYFKEYKKIESLETKQEIWATLIRGYDKKKFSKLTREEQQILHDTVGIFIAEEFRLLSRNSTLKLNQIMPAGMLIATYLQRGGEPLQLSKKKHGANEISHIPKSYQEFKLNWNYYDTQWSNYIRANHPNLAKEIEDNFTSTSSLPKVGDPPAHLFQKLIDYVENPTEFNEKRERIFNQTLGILWEESANINTIKVNK
jgi:hypothetical protein